MADKIPTLWPEDAVAVDVLSPVAILKVQAAKLAELTKGLLEAEVETHATDKGSVQHTFDVIAPALDGYRRRILTVTHAKDEVYPTRLSPTPIYYPPPPKPTSWVTSYIGEPREKPDPPRPYDDPTTEKEFIKLIGLVFGSRETKALLQSLIASSNEKKSEGRDLSEPQSHEG
jgi:hypothetical protein